MFAVVVALVVIVAADKTDLNNLEGYYMFDMNLSRIYYYLQRLVSDYKLNNYYLFYYQMDLN